MADVQMPLRSGIDGNVLGDRGYSTTDNRSDTSCSISPDGNSQHQQNLWLLHERYDDDVYR